MAEIPYAPEHIRALPSWLLGRAAAYGHRLVAQALATEGIRMMHHAVLSTVAERGTTTQADLSRILHVDPKDMVTIVRDLRAQDLITSAPDPSDRRRTTIALSPGGAALLHRTELLGTEANAELTAALTPDERSRFTDMLARIVAHSAARP